MSLEEYSWRTNNIDNALMEAEIAAQTDDPRYFRDEMYSMIRERINAAK